MLNDYIHSEFTSGSKVTNRASKVMDKSSSTKSATEKASPNDKKAKKQSPRDSPKNGKNEKDFKEQIKDKIQEFIGHYDSAPDYLKDNKFIKRGYRINFSTPKRVLRSLFMVHNESVNIWSHLGGAIGMIVLCIVLIFSMRSIDTQNLQKFMQEEVKDLFEPIYTSLPDFSKLEIDLSEKITQTKEDIAKLGENVMENFESSLHSLSEEIDQVKSNINPESLGRLLTSAKNELDKFSESMTTAVAGLDRQKLEEMSNKLKKNLAELQEEVISDIDSSKFDWIDIYRYINPNYSSVLTRKKDGQLIPLSRWPLMVFLFSAVFCLMCSAIFHSFFCLSPKAFAVLRRLDYAGISILITGSCFPPFVYGFYCQPFFSTLYLTLIGSTSVVVFFVSLGEKIHDPANIKWKAYMYGGLGTLAALPSIHLIYLTIIKTENDGNLNFIPAMAHYLTMGACYLGGLTTYSLKCPERFKPGKFDIVGHSHQIWHVCVLMGIILTYFGALDNYYTRLETPCFGCGL